MKHGMKSLLVFAGLFVAPSLCFAADYNGVDYYAEYSFAEAGEIDSAEIHGVNGWQYGCVLHLTKTDIQDRINRDRQIKDNGNTSFAFRRMAAEYMNRMLGASADKRIFVIDTSVEFGPYGWLFIKINENEYIAFFTGT
jgi:hypothetical protein